VSSDSAKQSAGRVEGSQQQLHVIRRTLATLEDSVFSDEETDDDDDLEVETVSSTEEQEELETSDLSDDSSRVAPLAESLQALLVSRRTVSRFLPPSLQQTQWLRSALDRAVRCAQNAPNHKRTEPFLFKRILFPSPSLERLGDIIYEFTLQKRKDNDVAAEKFAAKKRDKWSHIPAYMVALIEDQPNQEQELQKPEKEGANPMYLEYQYAAPETEKQLEDYAAACAAVQNILLSLHSEGIGTKWATGPVIKTPAFRHFVGAKQNDRVVGLIMVGESGQPVVREPRRRRSLGELLEDL